MQISFYEAEKQINLFTSSHVLYNAVVENHGVIEIFNFQCNKNRVPTKKDLIYSLLFDIDSYDCYRDMDDMDALDEFSKDYGYEKISDCLKAFRGCKEESEKMHILFTDAELEELREMVD